MWTNFRAKSNKIPSVVILLSGKVRENELDKIFISLSLEFFPVLSLKEDHPFIFSSHLFLSLFTLCIIFTVSFRTKEYYTWYQRVRSNQDFGIFSTLFTRFFTRIVPYFSKYKIQSQNSEENFVKRMSSYSHYSPSFFSSPSSPYSSSVSWWRRSSPSCSPDELTAIIVSPRGCYEVPCDPYNEVFPNIYIGDGTTALCTSLLRSIGVTHVLNAACGKDRSLNLINTSKGFYRESGIKFLGIEAYDMPSFCLSPFFREAADFIDDAIQNKGSQTKCSFPTSISMFSPLPTSLSLFSHYFLSFHIAFFQLRNSSWRNKNGQNDFWSCSFEHSVMLFILLMVFQIYKCVMFVSPLSLSPITK